MILFAVVFFLVAGVFLLNAAVFLFCGRVFLFAIVFCDLLLFYFLQLCFQIVIGTSGPL